MTEMKPALRFLFAVLVIPCSTTIMGAVVQDAHVGAAFEKACDLEDGEDRNDWSDWSDWSDCGAIAEGTCPWQ